MKTEKIVQICLQTMRIYNFCILPKRHCDLMLPSMERFGT